MPSYHHPGLYGDSSDVTDGVYRTEAGCLLKGMSLHRNNKNLRSAAVFTVQTNPGQGELCNLFLARKGSILSADF